VECNGAGQIGSADGTACEEDPAFTALAGLTMMEALCEKGAALIGAFAMTALFAAVVGAMQYKKHDSNKANKDSENKTNTLAVLPSQMVAIKACLTGFSFGSELFLLYVILGKAPGLAAVMIIFRLSHMVVAGTYITVLFGSSGVSAWLEDKGVVKKATTLPSLLSEDFCRANMSLLSGVVLLSMVDCSMMQFLPWKASLVYTESQGFPSLQLLRWCLGTDTVQATVSVLCQIIFLATSSSDSVPSTSGQLKALFAMNITTTVLGSVWGLTILYTKESLLSGLESEGEDDGNKNRGVGRGVGEAKNGLVVVNDGDKEEEREFGVADVYGYDCDGKAEMASVVNPMLAAGTAGKRLSKDVYSDARTQISKLSERRASLELKLDEALAQTSRIECENALLEEDNARLESESERDLRAAEL
jgi:hypothetical protein